MLFFFINLISSHAIYGQADGPERARIDKTFRQVKEISEDEASNPDSIILDLPVLISFVGKPDKLKVTAVKGYEVSSQKMALAEKGDSDDDDFRGFIVYKLGGIRTEFLGFDKGDPYAFPYEKQIYIEMLRRFFKKVAVLNEDVAGEPFWEPRLRQAELLVYQSVVDIEITADRDQLSSKQEELGRHFDLLMISLAKDLNQYSTGRGYASTSLASLEKVIGQLPTISQGNKSGAEGQAFLNSLGALATSPLPQVRVITIPPNATVQYMQESEYRICFEFNQGGKCEWTTLVQNPAPLRGMYYFQITWGDGKKTPPLKTNVRGTVPLEFKRPT